MNLRNLWEINRLDLVKFPIVDYPKYDERCHYIDFWNFWILTKRFEYYAHIRNREEIWSWRMGAGEWCKCSPEVSGLLNALYKQHISNAVKEIERHEY